MRQAAARWAHMPAGRDRDRRVRSTYEEIQLEAERLTLCLPDLTAQEREDLWVEAVLYSMEEVCGERLELLEGEAIEIVDLAVATWHCWCAQTRAAKDDRTVAKRARLEYHRRMLRLLEESRRQEDEQWRATCGERKSATTAGTLTHDGASKATGSWPTAGPPASPTRDESACGGSSSPIGDWDPLAD